MTEHGDALRQRHVGSIEDPDEQAEILGHPARSLDCFLRAFELVADGRVRDSNVAAGRDVRVHGQRAKGIEERRYGDAPAAAGVL